MDLQIKINLIIELNNAKYTEIDIALLRNLKPNHKALKRMGNVNPHNRKDMDEKALSALLDLPDVTGESIIMNREKCINESIAGGEKKKEAEQDPQGRDNQSQAGGQGTSTPSGGDKPKKTPKDLFPKIEWENTDDENVQLCIILFNDAVAQYHKVIELTVKMEDQPELAGEVVEADIRNKQSFKELEMFEATGVFNWEHPILKKKSLEKELTELYNKDSAGFLNQFKQAGEGKKRYKSQLKNKKHKNDKEKEAWEGHLERFTNKEVVMSEILEAEKKQKEETQ